MKRMSQKAGASHSAFRAKRQPKKQKPHELVAFVAIWAARYAEEHGLDGLHPTHYDLMAKHGALMDSFKRATISPCHRKRSGARQ